MDAADDLSRMARMTRLPVPPQAVEPLAARLEALYGDLDRLLALPLAGVEPAFAVRLPGAPDAEPEAR